MSQQTNMPTSMDRPAPDLAAVAAQRTVLDTAAWWVLCWSRSQNAIHVQPLEAMLAENRQAYCANRASDYVTMAIGRQQLCQDIAATLRNTLAGREVGRERQEAA